VVGWDTTGNTPHRLRYSSSQTAATFVTFSDDNHMVLPFYPGGLWSEQSTTNTYDIVYFTLQKWISQYGYNNVYFTLQEDGTVAVTTDKGPTPWVQVCSSDSYLAVHQSDQTGVPVNDPTCGLVTLRALPVF